jgi:iron complex transport system permease protein
MTGLAAVLMGPYGFVLPRFLGGDSAGVGETVVQALRVPRVLGGALVGAALAAAGLLAQTVTRNSLADPGLMGVASGALLGGVLGRLWWTNAETALAWPCISGALLATGLVLIVYQRLPHRSGVTLVLVGVAMNAVLGGVIAVLVAADSQRFLALRLWLAGSVAGRTSDAMVATAALVMPVLVASCLLGRQLDVLALGTDRARSLGARPALTTLLGVGTVAWLAGTATAFAGPISFVGLAAPHLARAITRAQRHTPLLLASAAIGATLIVATDAAGRAWASPGEVPVSVVCAVLGAPALIVFGLTRRKVGASNGTLHT